MSFIANLKRMKLSDCESPYGIRDLQCVLTWFAERRALRPRSPNMCSHNSLGRDAVADIFAGMAEDNDQDSDLGEERSVLI